MHLGKFKSKEFFRSKKAPLLFYQNEKEVLRKVEKDGKSVEEKAIVTENIPLILDGSDIKVSIHLDQRKKGLLWYSVYRASFSGDYLIKNQTPQKRNYQFQYIFPTKDGVYDNFSIKIGGKEIEELKPMEGTIKQKISLEPREEKIVSIIYETQGMDEWWYKFGEDVSQIKNFTLQMESDFDKIDFPENAISPIEKVKTAKGWKLVWRYSNLLSGIQIGMKMPQKINPGPFVSRLSYFAPVSLFLFFFLMFIITTVKNIKIHPMNFFFIACSFFSFHLLLAYLADLIPLFLGFVIASAVSIALVISYIRIVVGTRFALVETGISQFVYLVLFSLS
ncbi:MAG: inner membrane CreD family protein, partial [Acidobacteria bacterium]|nr:inner membrane CreD family protein [Acidobacteriota bacterium]